MGEMGGWVEKSNTCEMRRLATGCGAEVEHDSTARRAGEEGDGLCSGVLHGPLALLEPRKQARLAPSAHEKRTGQRRRRLDARTRCLELLAHRLEGRAAEVHAEGESGRFLARGGPCRERRFGRKRRGHVRKKILGEGAPNGERLSRGEKHERARTRGIKKQGVVLNSEGIR